MEVQIQIDSTLMAWWMGPDIEDVARLSLSIFETAWNSEWVKLSAVKGCVLAYEDFPLLESIAQFHKQISLSILKCVFINISFIRSCLRQIAGSGQFHWVWICTRARRHNSHHKYARGERQGTGSLPFPQYWELRVTSRQFLASGTYPWASFRHGYLSSDRSFQPLLSQILDVHTYDAHCEWQKQCRICIFCSKKFGHFEAA